MLLNFSYVDVNRTRQHFREHFRILYMPWALRHLHAPVTSLNIYIQTKLPASKCECQTTGNDLDAESTTYWEAAESMSNAGGQQVPLEAIQAGPREAFRE